MSGIPNKQLFAAIDPIVDLVIAVKATTLSITGLDGDADKEYRIYSRMVGGHAAGNCNYSLRPNDDAAANYLWIGSNPVAGASVALLDFDPRNEIHLGNNAPGDYSDAIVWLPDTLSNKERIFYSWMIRRVGGAHETIDARTPWSDSSNNIASFTLTASVADGIGIGSRIQLFAR